MKILLASSALLLVLGLAACSGAAKLTESTAEIPRIAENFQLTDQNRDAFELRYFADAPAIVLLTQASDDAVSRGSAEALGALQAEYAPKGAVFAMINSEPAAATDIPPELMDAPYKDLRVLLDENQLVGETLGVGKAGEAFVINTRTWGIVYHGPVDDRFTSATPGKTAQRHLVKDALDALIAAKPVEFASYDTGGAAIAFPERDRKAEHAGISYAADVAPVLVEKCASCHTDGGIGPFAMTSYEVVKGFAPMIREALRTDRMPPFNADPRVGQWKHDNSLSNDEIKTVVHWIEAGAPRGDGEDLLAQAVKPAPEWPLGKPDLILNLPAFNVPAAGVVDYQYPAVANPLKTTKWLRASTILPGDRAGVHHVLSGYMKEMPKPGQGGMAQANWQGSIGSYTPGQAPQVLPEGVGTEIPAGGAFGFQVHYTTSGKAATDVTRVGLYFHDKPPEFIKHSGIIADATIKLNPGQANQKTIAYLTFPRDALLYTAMPHAHYRGVRASLTAIYPDGKEELLLDLPKYDFNWQRDYDFAEPKLIPAGTKMVGRFTYDNSERNHANPDPKATVTWGEQTFQEMHYLRLNYRWMDETRDHRTPQLDGALMSSLMTGMIDDNLNGKVEPLEALNLVGAAAVMAAAASGQDVLGTEDEKQKGAGGGN